MFKLLIAMLSCIFVMNNVQSAEIIIRPGDVLQIEIPGEEDFENSFQVKRDGTLNLPEVGKVSIVGGFHSDNIFALDKLHFIDDQGKEKEYKDSPSSKTEELSMHVLGTYFDEPFVSKRKESNLVS